MVRTPLLLVLVSGLALVGCAKDKEAAAPAPNSGLSALTPDTAQSPAQERGQDVEAMAKQAAADIASLRSAAREAPDLAAAAQPLDIAPKGGATAERTPDEPSAPPSAGDALALRSAATEPGAPSEASTTTSPAPAPDMAASDLAWQQTVADQAWQNVATSGEAAPAGSAAVTSASPDARVIELSGVLARVLRQMDMEQMDPQVQAVFLAPIEQISPGILSSLDDPNSGLRQALSDEDVATLQSAHERAAQATPGGAPASPSVEAAFSVPNVQLCTRVRGFGQYEPCAGDSFPAGRPARVLIYSEVDGFKNRDADNGMKAVELAQRLSLFSDATGEAVWSTSEARVVETAHRVRRDFFLVQQVELPANLAIGSYTLKVTVSDAVGNAQAERTIPVKFHASVGSVPAQ